MSNWIFGVGITLIAYSALIYLSELLPVGGIRGLFNSGSPGPCQKITPSEEAYFFGLEALVLGCVLIAVSIFLIKC